MPITVPMQFIPEPPRARSTMMIEIPSGAVDEAKREAVADFVHFQVSPELDLGGDVLVRWFGPAPDGHHSEAFAESSKGFAPGEPPGEVWVRGDLSIRETLIVVAHECKHAEQFRRWRAGADGARDMSQRGCDRTAAEREADAFERRAIEHLIPKALAQPSRPPRTPTPRPRPATSRTVDQAKARALWLKRFGHMHQVGDDGLTRKYISTFEEATA